MNLIPSNVSVQGIRNLYNKVATVFMLLPQRANLTIKDSAFFLRKLGKQDMFFLIMMEFICKDTGKFNGLNKIFTRWSFTLLQFLYGHGEVLKEFSE